MGKNRRGRWSGHELAAAKTVTIGFAFPALKLGMRKIIIYVRLGGYGDGNRVVTGSIGIK